jgi:hypothetical protein
MTRGWLLAVIAAFGLVGCAGLRQFPEVAKDYDTVLRSLDADYAATLDLIYGKDAVPKAVVDGEQGKLLRQRMMERRMGVIDTYFKEFQAGLVKENVRADFGIALAGVGVGAAGSLVAETASQILSAVSGGLAGAQAAYGKAVLYDKAMSALLAQMQASRKAVAAQIFQRWTLGLDQYPLWMARTDLEAYYFAGSLPGAILATAADAKVKEAQADVILLRPITSESVTPAMFLRREALEGAIDALSGDKAKELVPKIEAEFTESKSFIDLQYPSSVRAADTNGDKAKVLLKRLMSSTVRNSGDADKWQQLISAP